MDLERRVRKEEGESRWRREEELRRRGSRKYEVPLEKALGRPEEVAKRDRERRQSQWWKELKEDREEQEKELKEELKRKKSRETLIGVTLPRGGEEEPTFRELNRMVKDARGYGGVRTTLDLKGEREEEAKKMEEKEAAEGTKKKREVEEITIGEDGEETTRMVEIQLDVNSRFGKPRDKGAISPVIQIEGEGQGEVERGEVEEPSPVQIKRERVDAVLAADMAEVIEEAAAMCSREERVFWEEEGKGQREGKRTRAKRKEKE